MQWPLENVPGDCVFESWITLEGSTARLRGKLTNQRSDHRQYPARGQELPAIYTNGAYYRLMTYRGAKPFTGGPLERIEKQGGDARDPWSHWQATEHWAALVRDDDWGLGVWFPGCQPFTGGFAGKPGAGGSHDNPTGYLTPNPHEILDHDIEYEFECVLVVGSLEAIRRYATEHDRPASPPRYRFAGDRRHWYLINATDQGWPIGETWRVKLEADDPQLISPEGLWQASGARRLVIEAAYDAPSGDTSGRDGGKRRGVVFWRRWEAPGFKEAASLPIEFIADGQMRRYELDLSASSEYAGAISGLRIDPTPSGASGESITVREIRFER